MKISSVCIKLLVAAIVCLLPAIALAVPSIMSYQGKLNDKDGVPITASVDMTFTIYDAASGGNNLWTETWSGVKSVNVKDGIFSIELGTHNPLSVTIFDKDNLWLGIKVRTDAEMVPRQRFTSGVYAMRAAPKTPIISAAGAYGPTGTTCNVYGPVYSVVVPSGESWELIGMWNWSYADGKYTTFITSMRVNINGTIFYPSVGGGGTGAGGGTGPDVGSGNNFLFDPPITILPSQTIVFEALSANMDSNYCTSNYTMTTTPGSHSIGYYYYKK